MDNWMENVSTGIWMANFRDRNSIGMENWKEGGKFGMKMDSFLYENSIGMENWKENGKFGMKTEKSENKRFIEMENYWLYGDNIYVGPHKFWRDGKVLTDFSVDKKLRILQVVGHHRKRFIEVLNSMIISDLLKVIFQFY